MTQGMPTLDYRSDPKLAQGVRRPTGVTVMAVIGMVVGGLMMVFAPIELGVMSAPPTKGGQALYWALALLATFRTVVAVLFLIGSVGLLALRPVARRLVLFCSLSMVVLWAVSVVMFLTLRGISRGPAGVGVVSNALEASLTLGVGALVGLLVPVLNFAFLDRAGAREAFSQDRFDAEITVDDAAATVMLRFLAIAVISLAGAEIVRLAMLLSVRDGVRSYYVLLPMSRSQPVIYVVCCLILAVVAIVSAVFMLLRSPWSRAALIVVCIILAVRAEWGWGASVARILEGIQFSGSLLSTMERLDWLSAGFEFYLRSLLLPAMGLVILTRRGVREFFSGL